MLHFCFCAHASKTRWKIDSNALLKRVAPLRSLDTSFSSAKRCPRSPWGALGGLLGLLWDHLGRQLRSLGALLGAMGRSWDALGTLLGCSWAALGTLLYALGNSWPLLAALGMLLDRFRELQGSILTSVRSPKSYFNRLLSNHSARTRTFRKSTESCPRTVREDSENQTSSAAQPALSSIAMKISGPAVFAQRTKYIDINRKMHQYILMFTYMNK